MMIFKIRKYQEKHKRLILRALHEDRDVLYNAPTGAGKSTVVTSVIDEMGKGDWNGAVVAVPMVRSAPVTVRLLAPVASRDIVVASTVSPALFTSRVAVAEPSVTVRVPAVAMFTAWFTASLARFTAPALELMETAPEPSMSMATTLVVVMLPDPSSASVPVPSLMESTESPEVA